jgi:hypothetical protein
MLKIINENQNKIFEINSAWEINAGKPIKNTVLTEGKTAGHCRNT